MNDKQRAELAAREADQWRERANRHQRTDNITEDYLERAAECDRRARSWNWLS